MSGNGSILGSQGAWGLTNTYYRLKLQTDDSGGNFTIESVPRNESYNTVATLAAMDMRGLNADIAAANTQIGTYQEADSELGLVAETVYAMALVLEKVKAGSSSAEQLEELDEQYHELGDQLQEALNAASYTAVNLLTDGGLQLSGDTPLTDVLGADLNEPLKEMMLESFGKVSGAVARARQVVAEMLHKLGDDVVEYEHSLSALQDLDDMSPVQRSRELLAEIKNQHFDLMQAAFASTGHMLTSVAMQMLGSGAQTTTSVSSLTENVALGVALSTQN